MTFSAIKCKVLPTSTPTCQYRHRAAVREQRAGYLSAGCFTVTGCHDVVGQASTVSSRQVPVGGALMAAARLPSSATVSYERLAYSGDLPAPVADVGHDVDASAERGHVGAHNVNAGDLAMLDF